MAQTAEQRRLARLRPLTDEALQRAKHMAMRRVRDIEAIERERRGEAILTQEEMLKLIDELLAFLVPKPYPDTYITVDGLRRLRTAIEQLPSG